MSQEYPRRREVRDTAEEMLHILLENYANADESFDIDFLTDVRDLMREGVSFSDAVMIVGEDFAKPQEIQKCQR